MTPMEEFILSLKYIFNMKIGLDLHGVISDMPDFFRNFAKMVVQGYGQLHIITGTSTINAIEELNKFGFKAGVHYTHLFSILDYHIMNDTPIVDYNTDYGNPEFDHKSWDETKGKYCEREKIDIHFDDSVAYERHFTTPFARVWTNTNTPKENKPERHLD